MRWAGGETGVGQRGGRENFGCKITYILKNKFNKKKEETRRRIN